MPRYRNRVRALIGDKDLGHVWGDLTSARVAIGTQMDVMPLITLVTVWPPQQEQHQHSEEEKKE